MAAKMFLELPGGFKMPALGLGTWQAKNEKELEIALDAALEAGYRHFDTAYVYQNEEFIGRVLKRWFETGKVKREELFITTKLPMIGIHPDRVQMFMDKSLKNLQLDYVDLYLIHFPVGTPYHEGEVRPRISENGDIVTEITDHIAVWKKMEEQVDAGKARSIGVSNFNSKQIDRILKSCRIKPANLQVELHVYLQQRDLVKFCQDNGITVVAYSPLGSPGFNQLMRELGKEPKQLPDMLNDPVIKSIADKHKKTNAQVMLRFLLQRNIAPIPKSVTPKRLKENIDVFDFTLDADDMKKLEGLDLGESGRVCDFEVFAGLKKNPEFPW